MFRSHKVSKLDLILGFVMVSKSESILRAFGISVYSKSYEDFSHNETLCGEKVESKPYRVAQRLSTYTSDKLAVRFKQSSVAFVILRKSCGSKACSLASGTRCYKLLPYSSNAAQYLLFISPLLQFSLSFTQHVAFSPSYRDGVAVQCDAWRTHLQGSRYQLPHHVGKSGQDLQDNRWSHRTS